MLPTRWLMFIPLKLRRAVSCLYHLAPNRRSRSIWYWTALWRGFHWLVAALKVDHGHDLPQLMLRLLADQDHKKQRLHPSGSVFVWSPTACQ